MALGKFSLSQFGQASTSSSSGGAYPELTLATVQQMFAPYGGVMTPQTLAQVNPKLAPYGAAFQFEGDGTLKPRIFFPDGTTIDIGDYGEAPNDWQNRGIDPNIIEHYRTGYITPGGLGKPANMSGGSGGSTSGYSSAPGDGWTLADIPGRGQYWTLDVDAKTSPGNPQVWLDYKAAGGEARYDIKGTNFRYYLPYSPGATGSTAGSGKAGGGSAHSAEMSSAFGAARTAAFRQGKKSRGLGRHTTILAGFGANEPATSRPSILGY